VTHAASLMLPQLHADGLASLLDLDMLWNQRNRIARTISAQQQLCFKAPPPRDTSVHQEYHGINSLVDNNQACALAILFSVMEDTLTPMADFDASERRFILFDGRVDEWLVRE